jgi:hypothetical protein
MLTGLSLGWEGLLTNDLAFEKLLERGKEGGEGEDTGPEKLGGASVAFRSH